MLLFSLDPECRLTPALAAALNVPVARHEERRFDDGERKLRPLSDPRGRDAYLVCSLHGGPEESPHDKLLRMLMFVATLKDHGTARVTVVVPYFAYARKDRQTKPFDPVTLRYVAQLFEAVGTDQAIVLEVHNVAAFQNAFRRSTIHLEAHRVFDPIVATMADAGPLAVASPDPGGVKRALLWRESLEARLGRPLSFAMVDKRRSQGIVSSQSLVAGDVAGATVLLLDDLIASGETMTRAATALRRAGARRVMAFAAHGLFTGSADATLDDPSLDELVVTDSVPPFRLPAAGADMARLRVVSAAPLFAEAIRATHAAWRRPALNPATS